MTILSLDASSKSTGWAIFQDQKLIDYGCITSSSTDLIKRIQIMTAGIKDILEKNTDIKQIILEEVRPQGGYGAGNLQTHRALMWLQASIAFMLYDNFKKKIELIFIYPSSWRATCKIKQGAGIKRDSQKQADIKFVKDTFGLDVNDDIADAIGIGYAQVYTNKPAAWSK